MRLVIVFLISLACYAEETYNIPCQNTYKWGNWAISHKYQLTGKPVSQIYVRCEKPLLANGVFTIEEASKKAPAAPAAAAPAAETPPASPEQTPPAAGAATEPGTTP